MITDFEKNLASRCMEYISDELMPLYQNMSVLSVEAHDLTTINNIIKLGQKGSSIITQIVLSDETFIVVLIPKLINDTVDWEVCKSKINEAFESNCKMQLNKFLK